MNIFVEEGTASTTTSLEEGNKIAQGRYSSGLSWTDGTWQY